MKVTTERLMVTRIEAEDGDTLESLWNAVGQARGGGWPVRIEDGAIIATQPVC